MTRKDFELIARTILDLPTFTQGGVTVDQRNKVAWRFAEVLRTTNPQFNAERFLKACGANPIVA